MTDRKDYWLYSASDSYIALVTKQKFAKGQYHAARRDDSAPLISLGLGMLSIVAALWFDTMIYGPYVVEHGQDLMRMIAIMIIALFVSLWWSYMLNRKRWARKHEKALAVYYEVCDRLRIVPNEGDIFSS